MKLELKENMYVRTKDGIIDKVTIDYKGKCNSPNCNCKHVCCQYNYYDEVDIINASHNIIDLIEVGDYVNGYKVSFKDNDYKPFVQCDYPVQEGTTNHYRFYEEAIYSIVTKEQFEKMAYKVGD